MLATGLAGGCAPDLVPGEVVVGDLVGDVETGRWWAPDPALFRRALAGGRAAGIPARVGHLVSLPRLAATPEAKAALWREHGAVAVDMESARVLAWAAAVGCPALAVRAVADGPRDPLPPAWLGALGPDGRLRLRGLLGCARSPALLWTGWRTWRASTAALDRLGRFLRAFLAAG